MPNIEISFPIDKMVEAGYENGQMKVKINASHAVHTFLYLALINCSPSTFTTHSENEAGTRVEMDGVTFDVTDLGRSVEEEKAADAVHEIWDEEKPYGAFGTETLDS